MSNWHEKNKERANKQARERYYKDKEAYKVRAWRNHLLRDYGLTEEEYKTLWSNQNGLCCICKVALNSFKTKPHLDHNHTSGEIRGILCPDCNRGLGAFKDNPSLLKEAIKYLGKV